MRKYLMCLNEHDYNVIVGDEDNIIRILDTYETMLDNLIYLLKTIGAEDEEILEEIKDNLDIEIEECE